MRDRKICGPRGLRAHVVDIGAHPLALAEALARQQFVAPQHRLGAAEIDDDIAELDPLDEAVDDLADAVLELGVLPLPLGVAHLLDDDLLRGLRRDAAEIDRRQRVGDEIADLGLGVEALRRGERHLRRLVLDLVDDLAEAQQADLAAAPVDLGADVVFLAVFRAPGLLDGLLHRLEDFVLVDALVAGDRVGDLQQLGAGVGGGAFHRASVCHRASERHVRLAMRLISMRLAGLARRQREEFVVQDELGACAIAASGKRTSPPSAASRTCVRFAPEKHGRETACGRRAGSTSSMRASNPAKRS